MPKRYQPRKYDPLTRYLAALTTDEVTLTFGEIEAILGAPLPRSARLREWWANSAGSTWARAWLSAGWRVERRQLWGDSPAVTFVRARRESRDSPPR